MYQRFSVSSHCTAFSYKPLIDYHKIDEIELNQDYVLECPSTFCEQFSNLEPIFDKTDESDVELESLTASYDDIFESVGINKSDSTFLDRSENEKSKFFQIKNILNLHTEQIFLGMVSMQYKARIVFLHKIYAFIILLNFFLHNKGRCKIGRNFDQLMY